ncbi:N-acyl-D-amino-acid deacylase family protein [Gemmatimonas sp. UBA7669]|uniref:N-acyl-D-amino-acid deacylase family protein n=1 Tax=Gemmatimonas sp. UBA7669 TaxID=1946568 RepID=UPI0025BF3A79|nr:D-aminoacylase [Gemmatimonas sp. UBA7669]
MNKRSTEPNRTRRDLLKAGAIAAASLSAPSILLAGAPYVPSRRAYDLVLRGGAVLDGSGTPARRLDIAVTAGRIVAMQPAVADRGTEEIDARGMTVAPGFIDIHSHGDGGLRDDPRMESVIRQGITSIVVGADGSSRFSGDAGNSFAAWEARTNALRPSVNIASMIGLGTVRGAVVGESDRRASASEMARMTAMVERAVSEGACGASSGLEYTPGAFASESELVALCRPLSARGLSYATHMRNEDDQLLESIDESIAVARGARCGLQVSHLKQQGTRNWSKIDACFARLRAARAEGIAAWFDVYPYVAYATGLTNLFPTWSRDGGDAAFLARLADPATAPRIRQEVLAKVELIGGWDNVQISRVARAEDRDAEGKRLGTWAAAQQQDPYEAVVGLLRRNNTDVGMLGFAMSEDNLDRLLAHEFSMVCSDGGGFAIDGPTRRGSPHPRGAGTFPRVLGRYVRERRALSLEQAVHRMTARPASRVRLSDRGLLAVGMAADIVVFDPATVSDTATFANPFQYPVGIVHVVVNGYWSLRNGERPGDGTGRVLRVAS